MQENHVDLTPDTGSEEHSEPHPHDPQKTGSGSAQALGGGDAPAQSASDMSQSGEAYPGPRSGGEAAKSGETPRAANAGERTGAGQGASDGKR